MYVRCVDCQASSWIRALPAKGEGRTFSCEACGREHEAVTPDALDGTTKQQYQAALTFAEDHGIDLPCAYSVLLGMMTIEQARGDEEPPGDAPAPRAEATAPATPSPSGRRSRSRQGLRIDLDYDPGFADAVAEGFLTVKEARQRGDRDLLARRLTAEHDLPTVLAYLAADNKITVEVARQRVREERLAERLRAGLPLPVSRGQLAWIGGLSVPAVLALVVFGWVHWNRHTDLPLNAVPHAPVTRENAPTPAPATESQSASGPPATTAAAAAAEIERDDEGRLTRIAARTPEAVLAAFCEASRSDGQLTSLGVVPGVPATASARLGVYRDFRDLEVPFAIRIRRARGERIWTTGNGSSPIVPLRDPRLSRDPAAQAVLSR